MKGSRLRDASGTSRRPSGRSWLRWRARKLWPNVYALVQMPVLSVVNRVSKRPLVDRYGSSVVSLTSYQSRLKTVHLTIESIGRGRARPKRLVLWVDPDVVINDLPTSLQRLRARGLEIASSPDGYGPHTKYFPYVMSEAPHTAPLVTADDDCIYPRSWLRLLQEAASSSDDVVCFRAHRITFDAAGRMAPYNSWTPVADRSASVLNFASGVSGAAYPPAFLDELAQLGDAFMHTCPKADDVWLHYAAVRSGRRVRQVGRRAVKFPDVLSTQKAGLYLFNNDQQGNDPQLASTYSADVIDALRTADTVS